MKLKTSLTPIIDAETIYIALIARQSKILTLFSFIKLRHTIAREISDRLRLNLCVFWTYCFEMKGKLADKQRRECCSC